ncbi:hypothetical protein IMCC20628_00161 [Hoeflea sp. IMCC20628]|uniref:hypothetical protein n=1 Tax=Hoeflea sp. IMCC20628 TaxID=1620421 RepID=UPI00063ACC45|nr:hypothetical protein [Hoeflea sp. IMCC20628]AKH98890.1 hypothetical protein IMCC20628_00161 [Hoeflea sp. IMCC20628]
MAKAGRDEERRTFAEEADSLWLITFAGSIWAVHFVLCYGATAAVCAKLGGDAAAIATLRLALGGFTLLALAGIALVAWRSWVQWDFLDDWDYEHDMAEKEDRHEFLGHASFLISIISFIGVIYVSLPVLVLETCQ